MWIFDVEQSTKFQNNGTENLFNEIIKDNILNLGKDVHIYVEETFRTTNKYDQKRTSLCHIIVKI